MTRLPGFLRVARGQKASPNPGSGVARGLQLLDQGTPEHTRGLDGLVSRRPQNWPQTEQLAQWGGQGCHLVLREDGPLHAWGLIHADRIPIEYCPEGICTVQLKKGYRKCIRVSTGILLAQATVGP